MKYFFTIIFFLPALSIADSHTDFHQILYEALDIEEAPESSNKLEQKYTKSMNGLTCLKTIFLYEQPNYSCTIEPTEVIPSELYETLDIEAVPFRAPKTTLKYLKSIKNLRCLKVDSIQTGLNYSCFYDSVELGNSN